MIEKYAQIAYTVLYKKKWTKNWQIPPLCTAVIKVNILGKVITVDTDALSFLWYSLYYRLTCKKVVKLKHAFHQNCNLTNLFLANYRFLRKETFNFFVDQIEKH